MAKLREYVPDYDSRAAYLERRGRLGPPCGLHEIIQEARTFSTRLRFPVESGRMVEAVARADEEAGRHLGALAGSRSSARSRRTATASPSRGGGPTTTWCSRRSSPPRSSSTSTAPACGS